MNNCFLTHILLIILTHFWLYVLRIFVQLERIFNTSVKNMLSCKRGTSTVHHNYRTSQSKSITNAFISVSNDQMIHQTAATWTYLIKAQKHDESTNYLHELIKSLFVQVLKLLGKLLRKSHLSRKFLYFINFENWKIFNLRTVLAWNCYCHTLFNEGL